MPLPLTVGDLRSTLAGLPDDARVDMIVSVPGGYEAQSAEAAYYDPVTGKLTLLN